MKKFFLILGIIASLLGVIASTTAILNNSNHHICDFSEKVSNKLPTCTSNGIDFYYCTCGKFILEDIPALEHNFSGSTCVNCGINSVNISFFGDEVVLPNGSTSSVSLSKKVAVNTFWDEVPGVIINNKGYALLEIGNGTYAFIKSGNNFVSRSAISSGSFKLYCYGTEGFMDVNPHELSEYWITYTNNSNEISGCAYLEGAQIHLRSASSFMISPITHWVDDNGKSYTEGELITLSADIKLTAVR